MVDDQKYRCRVYNEIVAESLTKKNSKYWFECVRNYLIARDVWDVVDGTFPKPPEDDENHKQDFVNWKKMNAGALHVILISCGTHAFVHVSHVSEAQVAWDILIHTYNYNSRPQSEPLPQLQGRSSALPVHPSTFEPSTSRGIATSTTAVNEKSGSEGQGQSRREEEAKYDVSVLYKGIRDNDLNIVKALVEEHPSSLVAKITDSGRTALHVAASFGHVKMVEELVALVGSPQDLEIIDSQGLTPLSTACAYSGDTRVVQCMLNKNQNVLAISTSQGSLPVRIAIFNGHKHLGRYLYPLTPLESLKPNTGIQGIALLDCCFNSGELGIALDLLERCEDLILAHDRKGKIPIMKIAAMASVFSNGSELVFWKKLIYNYINIQPTTSTNSIRLNIQHQGKSENDIVKGIRKEIYEMKLVHRQAAQILSLLCEKVSFLGSNMKRKERDEVIIALSRAAEEGNVEFVKKVSKADPQLLQLVSKDKYWNIFFNAIACRQPQVFNLIHGIRFKDRMASMIDKNDNTMLHVVANLAPSSKLNQISGPAFQMQSELQWFKEVESVVPQGYRVYKNVDGMQPKEVFKENHKELRNEGEKWMKDTASSCSVVAALIVTIMFAAAFTVPGGNNQDFGYPIFLEKKLFTLFVISDVLSLFSSTTSMLIFLGVLTSRYAEEDFLKSLPTKLIIGLSTLFLSIATMMIAFSATILLMLEHRSHSWIYLPLIILASVPITLFVLLQFPLFVRMVYSTYGPGIFKRNVEPWL